MPNIQNLRPKKMGDLTPEEQKRMASNGGKKSGEVRRKRKTFKELFVSILSTDIKDEELKAQIKKTGVDEETTYNTMVGLTVLKEAVKGNMKAVEIIRDTIGEKPKDKVEIKDITPKWFK